MRELVSIWWRALLEADISARVIAGENLPRHFTRHLVLGIVLMYAAYGFSMGLFRGFVPAVASGLKLPFLYLFTVAVCFPALYCLSGVAGASYTPRQLARLLVLSTSANAVALVSYAPFALFFTLTTSRDGYRFLVLTHVAALAVAGILSLLVIVVILRGALRVARRRVRAVYLIPWALLYALVGTQMSWVLRPWIGSWGSEYEILRPRGGSFIEAVWQLLT